MAGKIVRPNLYRGGAAKTDHADFAVGFCRPCCTSYAILHCRLQMPDSPGRAFALMGDSVAKGKVVTYDKCLDIINANVRLRGPAPPPNLQSVLVFIGYLSYHL